MAAHQSIEERFWSKVDKSAGQNGCWVWTAGTRRHGYGAFRREGCTLSAHRMAWQLTYGPIPAWTGQQNGACVLHRCDTPACVNPSHLFLGTNAQNVADMVAKGRQWVPTGDANGSRTRPERIARGTAHVRAKLTESDVIAIRADPRSQRLVAADYGVSQSSISLIRRRQVWAHVA